MGLRRSILIVHKDLEHQVERVLHEHTGNLQVTDNPDERVVVTVTSHLAHSGEGDDAAHHPIEHHKILHLLELVDMVRVEKLRTKEILGLARHNIHSLGLIWRWRPVMAIGNSNGWNC